LICKYDYVLGLLRGLEQAYLLLAEICKEETLEIRDYKVKLLKEISTLRTKIKQFEEQDLNIKDKNLTSLLELEGIIAAEKYKKELQELKEEELFNNLNFKNSNYS
jgi:hypothetical protein